MSRQRHSITERALVEIYGFMNLKPKSLQKFINEYGEVVIAFAETAVIPRMGQRHRPVLPEVLVGMIFSYFVGNIGTKKERIIHQIPRSTRFAGQKRYIPRKITAVENKISLIDAKMAKSKLARDRKNRLVLDSRRRFDARKIPNTCIFDQNISVIEAITHRLNGILNEISIVEHSIIQDNEALDNFSLDINECNELMDMLHMKVEICEMKFELTNEDTHNSAKLVLLEEISNTNERKTSLRNQRAVFDRNNRDRMTEETIKLHDLQHARKHTLSEREKQFAKNCRKEFKLSSRAMRKAAKGQVPRAKPVAPVQPDLTGTDPNEWPSL